jgi:glycolate oxidase iron-sulfur subunit
MIISPELKEQVYHCIRCGLCLNSCPVYRQLCFEGASPRGKIQLIKKVLEGQLEASDHFGRLLGTCLLCETCSVTCPSGVKLDRIMKSMRAELIKTFGVSWEKRAVFHLLSSSHLLPFMMFWGRTLENPLRLLLPQRGRAGTIPYAKIPRLNAKPLIHQFPEVVTAAGQPKGRVLYFVGCATNYLFENVGRSLIRLLNRLEVEVIIPQEQMCCGFPICLAGARTTALKNIRHNLDLFDPQKVDAVIVDCATCGAALKREYPQLLEEMGEEKAAAAARRLAQKVLDISQYLARFELAQHLKPLTGKVTYHDPCHLLRTQGIKEEPRNVLRSIPELELIEMEGAEVCCGGGGVFQLDHPELASAITAKKIQTIRDTQADMVATGCPGCRLQIHGNLEDDPVEVFHPVELLAKAFS